MLASELKRAKRNAAAFGSKLLGALVADLLDALYYLIGIKTLVIAAVILYLFSVMATRPAIAEALVTAKAPPRL